MRLAHGLALFLLCLASTTCLDFSPSKIRHYRCLPSSPFILSQWFSEKARAMFYHAYNGYLEHAFPLDELKPLSCTGMDTWGSFSLTLIDALDTLLILGNHSEFARAVDVVLRSVRVDANVNVSVFETNIRVVGGLLSAHMLAGRVPGLPLEPGWPCSGPLLRLAERVAQRLLPAFNTDTGMPYGTVNLRYGVHRHETPVTCTAGVGTFVVEFGALSKLTGNPLYEKVALRALDSLWKSRSPLGLVGNHINVQTGAWTATDAGIGAGVDSYFEYLAKDYMTAINKWVRKEDWFMWVSMTKGTISLPIFQSLEAFWPGILVLIGEVEDASRIMLTYHQIVKQYGFPPEFYNIPNQESVSKRSGYPLRPEIVESLMYLYRATEDPVFLQIGVEILEAIEFSCKTRCGYATVKNVLDHRIEDRMESFFLAETTKYLYLLFDPHNFIHNDGTHARVIETTNGQCVVDAGGYVFNTEAHPLDPGILYCCSARRQHDVAMIKRFEENIDFISLMGLQEMREEKDTGEMKQPLQEADLPSETLDLARPEKEPSMYFERQYGSETIEYEVERPAVGEQSASGDGERPSAVIGPPASEAGTRAGSILAQAADTTTPALPETAASQSSPSVATGTIVQATEAEEKKELREEIAALLARAREIDARRATADATNATRATAALVETMKELLDEWKGLMQASKSLERENAKKRRRARRKSAGEEAVVVAECQNCCRVLDLVGDSVSLRRMLNAVYSKHIYPSLRIPFVLGPICTEAEQPRIEDDYSTQFDDDFDVEMGDEASDAIDELSFGSFRYRELATKQYRLLTAPPLPFRARFSALGQVMPKDVPTSSD